jgi:hypothetical protein
MPIGDLMTDSKNSKTVVSTVLRRLKSKDKPERTKRTLVLSKTAYETFETLCRKEGRYPSDVIDEFIAMFIEEKN